MKSQEQRDKEFITSMTNLAKKSMSDRAVQLEKEVNKEQLGRITEGYKEEINSFSDKERAVLLAMCMESIRGSWTYVEERLGVIGYICDTWTGDILPKELLEAVKHNAYMFTGEYCDGRVFRDGDRATGLSGNITYYVTGDDRVKLDTVYGKYDEVWNLLGCKGSGEAMEKLRDIMKKVYPLVNEDLTFEDLNEGEDW